VADPVTELYYTSLLSANRVHGHNEQANASGETFGTYFFYRVDYICTVYTHRIANASQIRACDAHISVGAAPPTPLKIHM